MGSKKNDITLELLKLYETHANELNISADLSKVLHGITDIKASGNEIEIALRNILKELLPKKYSIGHGHIIDKNLSVSRQYDLVVSEGLDYRSVIQTKDTTEIFFFETVFAIGEVKATWNGDNLKSTVHSITDLREKLTRNSISNKTLISGNSEVHINTPVTNNPIRNPLFTFSFSIKADKLHKLSKEYQKIEWVYLPNISVILNEGLFVLVEKSALSEGKLSIQLYPEFAGPENCEWKFIKCKSAGKSLAYLLFCLLEHLSITMLEKPPYLNYSSSILNIHDEDLLNLDEL